MVEELLNWVQVRLFWLVKPFYRRFCIKKLPLHYMEHWKQLSDRASSRAFCFILFYEQINYQKTRYNCFKNDLREAWASYKLTLWKLQHQLLSFETSKKCFLKLWLHTEHRYIYLFYWMSKSLPKLFLTILELFICFNQPKFSQTKNWIALRKLLKQKISYKNPFPLIFNWIWFLTNQFNIFVFITKLLNHSSNWASWYFCLWISLINHVSSLF